MRRGFNERQIEEAKKGLMKLIPAEEFKGRSFLDIVRFRLTRVCGGSVGR
jgi:hypothetical protein